MIQNDLHRAIMAQQKHYLHSRSVAMHVYRQQYMLITRRPSSFQGGGCSILPRYSTPQHTICQAVICL